jgi:tripartite-type tricarboxylate transporter receptor subunit TctC
MTFPTRAHVASRRLLLGLAACAGLPRNAGAQGADFPSRPLTLVVPYGAASTNDILARLLAPALTERLGQSVVVENRAGAGGTVGIGQVVRSQPDGHTLVIVSASSIPINRALYRNLPFDPLNDLTVVSVTSSTPNALIVRAESPFKTLSDLTAAARAGGTPLQFFSPGNGTSQHLSCVQLARSIGARMEHIPYRGPAEAITGLLAGETAFGFASVPSVLGLVREGRLRALGTTGTRASNLPGVPTLASAGFADFAETDVWYGVAGPRGIAEPVRAKLRSALQDAVAAPALRGRLAQAGFDAVPAMDAAEGDAFVARQVAFWAELVRQSGATID